MDSSPVSISPLPPLPSDPSLVPSSNLPSSPHRPTKLIVFVSGFAILFLGIFMGYLATNVLNQSKKASEGAAAPSQKSSTNFPQLAASPIPTLAKVADIFTGWKTHTNTDYGFSFSYPKELGYIYDHLKGGNILLQNFDGSGPRKELDSDFQMVFFADDTNTKPLEDYPKQWESELGKFPTETISVGGVTAMKGFSGQKYQAVPTVWFSKNATTFMIQLSHPKSTNKIWFDQILSTFKFLWATGGSNIRTYTSPEVVDYYSPYLISYPSDWTLTEQKLTNPDGLIVTITSKSGSTVIIGQYVGDGGRCVYSEDADYLNIQGAGKQFSLYTQLKVPSPAKWRLSVPNLADKFTSTVCEAGSSAYIDTTQIGSIQINLKSEDNLNDVQTILESVQFKPTGKTRTLFN